MVKSRFVFSLHYNIPWFPRKSQINKPQKSKSEKKKNNAERTRKPNSSTTTITKKVKDEDETK
jgi:hypothetical protein